MRINEILNTQEQLGLWQIISDTVFTTLVQNGQQAMNQQAVSQTKPNIIPPKNALKPPLPKPSIRPIAKPTTPVIIQPRSYR